MTDENDSTLKKLLLEALKLKELDRKGWKRIGVQNPESVAAHSWSVAWLVLTLCPRELDLARALKMAIIHDLAEVRTGDITPHDGVERSEKSERESEALEAMLAPIKNRHELIDLWREFEDGRSAEARFVRNCDKLDMGLQAIHYKRSQKTDVAEFLKSACDEIEDQSLIDLLGWKK